MELDEFRPIMDVLLGAYPHFKANANTMRAYHTGLKQRTAPAVTLAAERIISREQFFPSVALLVKEAERAQHELDAQPDFERYLADCRPGVWMPAWRAHEWLGYVRWPEAAEQEAQP
jgi:hypothetical protein